MDPLTSFTTLLTELLKLVGKIIDGQPPEVRAELWKLYLEDVKAMRAFFEQFHPKP